MATFQIMGKSKLRAEAPIFQPVSGLMYFPVTSNTLPPPPSFTSYISTHESVPAATPPIAKPANRSSSHGVNQDNKSSTPQSFGQQKSATQVLESQTKMLKFLSG